MFNVNLLLLLLFVFFMISVSKIMTLSKEVRKINRTLKHLIKKNKENE
jgi:hypothetical protein|tara:strand:+ start:268 stop:411 length:144 start_codon:yes stop_codon:yes gene_type:complete